jgi:DNA repair photolyase
MLGELYIPKGKALETAQQVLEIDNPMACNIAMGCTNECNYCYIPYIKSGEIRFPKQEPLILVKNQLEKKFISTPKGVFLSFMTDPFLFETSEYSVDLINFLIEQKITIATLSKRGTFFDRGVRSGMTITSLDFQFFEKYESFALPPNRRIESLKFVQDKGCYTWVSLEPYPTPAIWEQDIIELLDRIKFVDFIIFGKWNYDKRAKDKEFYRKTVKEFEDYCTQNKIRHFVKTDTKEFIK